MRAFIALETPTTLVRDLTRLTESLATRVPARYLRPETYHATLAFLGEVDQHRARRAERALAAAIDDSTPIELIPRCLGFTGRASDAVLWVELERTDALMALQDRLVRALRERRVPFDEKPFRPHITIARRARIADGALEGADLPGRAIAPRATLFKSDLMPTGAVYTALWSSNLPQI